MTLPDPMLASAGDLPVGMQWCFEPKWDRIRAVVSTGSGARMRSRPGRDLAGCFPEVISVLERLPTGTVLDGELVVAGEDGRADFRQVRARLRGGGSAPRADCMATLVVFDVLVCQGLGRTGASWSERREVLDGLDLDGEVLTACPVVDDGQAGSPQPTAVFRWPANPTG